MFLDTPDGVHADVSAAAGNGRGLALNCCSWRCNFVGNHSRRRRETRSTRHGRAVSLRFSHRRRLVPWRVVHDSYATIPLLKGRKIRARAVLRRIVDDDQFEIRSVWCSTDSTARCRRATLSCVGSTTLTCGLPGGHRLQAHHENLVAKLAGNSTARLGKRLCQAAYVRMHATPRLRNTFAERGRGHSLRARFLTSIESSRLVPIASISSGVELFESPHQNAREKPNPPFQVPSNESTTRDPCSWSSIRRAMPGDRRRPRETVMCQNYAVRDQRYPQTRGSDRAAGAIRLRDNTLRTGAQGR